MRVLLLGNSDIGRRRVIPALARLNFREILVASRTRHAIPASPPPGATVRTFEGYEAGLEHLGAGDLVYVSTVNSDHARWAARAVARGCHVVVDKPAFASAAEAAEVLGAARQRGVCVAEATVYGDHPQFDAARRFFADAGSRPSHLVAAFCMPPLPAGNFRHRRAFNGGALYDLGPYAVTPGRLFFGVPPREVVCRVHAPPEEPDGVEASFSVLATYDGGRSMVGQYGFGSGYVNRLEVLGPGARLAIDRAFTTPPDLENELQAAAGDQRRAVRAPAGDAFELFLGRVLAAIASGDHEPLARDLMADAHAMDLLRRSAAAAR